jgi:hypothetical protein
MEKRKTKKLFAMKNILFIIAGLLIVAWAVIVFFFHPFGAIHILLVLAGFIILIRIALRNLLSL